MYSIVRVPEVARLYRDQVNEQGCSMLPARAQTFLLWCRYLHNIQYFHFWKHQLPTVKSRYSLKLGRLGLCFQKPVEGVTDKCLLPIFRSRHPFTKSFHSINIKILELYRECYAGPGPIFTRMLPATIAHIPQWCLNGTSVVPQYCLTAECYCSWLLHTYILLPTLSGESILQGVVLSFTGW